MERAPDKPTRESTGRTAGGLADGVTGRAGARGWLRATLIVVSAIAVAVLAFAVWQSLPERHSYYSDADRIREPAAAAEPRDVLWQPPQRVADLINSAGDEYEPRLSWDGMTLYFVRGKAGENADIYVTQRTPAGWTAPVALEIVNGNYDDLGPEPSPDGQLLYFYSDRPGGSGGYDLWVSQRAAPAMSGFAAPALSDVAVPTSPGAAMPPLPNNAAQAPGVAAKTPLPAREGSGEGRASIGSLSGPIDPPAAATGWLPAVNLGPAVNSEFNEYGPAVAPDGKTIYFASNRPSAADTKQPDPHAWPATLREDFFHRPYDLYTAAIGDSGPSFLRPLTALNTPANEGSPAISPAGDFLYFSSDRPAATGGFDLYRARIVRGELQPPLNLAQINTPANELDPALGMGGFSLYFSSNRTPQGGPPGKDGEYNLYQTVSREVFRETETTPRAAINWNGLWRTIGPNLLWALLGLLSIIFLLALLRGFKDKRLSLLMRCLLVSLLLHSLILFMTSFWRVTAAVATALREGGGGVKVSLAPPAGQGGGDLYAQVRGGVSQVAAPAAKPVEVQRASFTAPIEAAAAPPSVQLAAETVSVPIDASPRLVTQTADARPVERWTPQSPVPVAFDDRPRPQLPDVAIPNAEPPVAAAEPTQSLRPDAAPPLSTDRPAIAIATSQPSIIDARVALAPQETPRPAAEPLPTFSAQSAATRDAPSIGTGADFVPVQLAGDIGVRPVALAADTNAPPLDLKLPDAPRLAGATGTNGHAGTNGAGSATGPGGERTAPHPQPVTGGPGSAGRASLGANLAPAAGSGIVTRVDLAPTSAGTNGHAGGVGRVSNPSADGVGRVSNPSAGIPGDGAGSGGGAGTNPGIAGSGPGFGGGPHSAAGIARDAPAGGISTGTDIYGGGPGGGIGGGSGGGAGDGQGPAVGGRGGAPYGSPNGIPGGSPRMDMGLRLPTDIEPPENKYAQREPESRADIVERLGGSKQTEDAVAAALAWLARHQSADGRWDGDGFDLRCNQCGGQTDKAVDVALTGLSLLCFLGAGHTHEKPGPYADNVRRGLLWLTAQQQSNGDLRAGEETMYSHGIASIALCEALAMSSDSTLRERARATTHFIVTARDKRRGGWRYEPGQPGDTSVLGWQIMALRSAAAAGLDVPYEGFDSARRWLENVESSERPGLYAYRPGRPVTPTMTAEALLTRQILGEARDDAATRSAVAYLLQNPPDWNKEPNTYYWYYATLALFQQQGEAWTRWNKVLVPQLLEHQHKDGPRAGSWDPFGEWALVGGRVYQTALCTLMLEIYYRYLPTFAAEHAGGARTISGLVSDAVTGKPLPDAEIRLDVPPAATLTAKSGPDGRYKLEVPEVPAFFALSAAHDGYDPATVNIAAASLRASGVTRDFKLRPTSPDVIVLDDSPEVHHLGNDLFEGSINSQFQRAAEGDRYTARFNVEAQQLDGRNGAARLTFLAKGVQCPHEVFVNGTLLRDRLKGTPDDGGFGELALRIPLARLTAGENTLDIQAVSCTGDLDDFEFVNLQIVLPARIEASSR